jgi:rhomboid protease GluP
VNDPVALPPRTVSYNLPLSRPIATYVLLGLIGLVFAAETLAGGSTQTEVLVRLGAKVTPLIAAGEYWRLLTAMFLHIGVMHLFFNAYALFALGTELERLLGWGRFVVIYLLSGLYGSLVSYALSPNLSAGASGAIFGLIGALAAFFALHRQQLGSWGQRRLANIAFLIIINLFLGFTQPGIDNLAHLGGLLSGLPLGLALAPRYKVDLFQQRLVDRNSPRRYWPAIALAVLLLIGGVVLVTNIQRDSPMSHLWRAQEAAQREAWDEAVDELEKAVAGDPSLADASFYFSLGYAHNQLGQLEQAADAYQAALALEPDDPASHWNLALTYLQLDRYAEARTHFESYQQLDPAGAGDAQPYLDELRRLTP